MRRKIIIAVLLLGYFCLLWVGAHADNCDTVSSVSWMDGSSAGFYDYGFEIQSVSNDEYNDIVGKKFTLREGCKLIGSTMYEIDDKVNFELHVISFQIKNHRIFPFRIYFIGGNSSSSLIGIK